MSGQRKRKDSETRKLAALQAATYHVATTWHADLGLDFYGVNLGDCLAYSMIQNLNQAVMQELEGAQDGR